MKIKTLLFLFLAVLCYCQTNAQVKFNSNQLKFRNDINQFLKEEGYTPTINADGGEIRFKMEGTNYEICISEDYTNPFLVSLSAVFNMEKMSVTELNHLYETINRTNALNDCIKAFYFDYGGVTRLLEFTNQSIVHSSESYKYSLVKYLSMIKSTIAYFGDKYESTAPNNPNNGTGIGESYYTTPKLLNSPAYTTTKDNTSLVITDVRLSSEETKVYFKYTNNYGAGGWCSIDESTYIVSYDTGAKYKMKRAEGIPYSPQKHEFRKRGEQLSFVLVFPPLPSSTTKFNLIESAYSEWRFYDIKIK